MNLASEDLASESNNSAFNYDVSKANMSLLAKRGNKYPSPPLPDNAHIRLVELVAPQPYTVSLKFHTTRLDEAPEFSALSYTWGTSSRNVEIRGVRITDNLFAALMNLAEENPKVWWIDALCINQDDIDEKNKQVGIMRLIYEKARQVCIWLGEPDVVSIELMRKIARSLQGDAMPTPGIEYSDEELQKLGLPPFEHPDWGTLMKFLARPYFRRVWVLQELTMAKLPIMVACGRLRFNWGLIALSTHWMRVKRLLGIFQSQSPAPLRDDPHVSMQDVTSISLTLKDPPRSRSLEHLLGISYYLESTDPRDKIFALLGLALDEDESVAKIAIDYDQPVADLYREVTGIIMTTRRSLKLLLLKVDSSLQQVKGLPSWVPDYSVGRGRPEFRYAHFITPGKPIDIQWQRGSNALQISGQIIDEVDVLGDNVATYKSDPEEGLLTWFATAAQSTSTDQWNWILSLAEPENAINRNLNQFWRTMLGDEIEDQSPAPIEYKDHFAATIFQAFFRQNISDRAWLRQLAAAIAQALEEEQRGRDAPLEISDPTIAHLLQWSQQEGQKTPIIPPEWKIPQTWIDFGRQGEVALGPVGNRNAFIVQMSHTTFETRFFITKSGRMGRGPMSLAQGDQIMVVDGTDQVLIVREKPGGFQFVGECYVHGLMRGEGRETVSEYRKITLF